MADRTYSKAFEINRSAIGFNYLEDLTLNGGSGAWRPMRPSDFASITLSGASVTVDNTPVIQAIASGNATLVNIWTSEAQNVLATASGNASLQGLFGAIGSGNAIGSQNILATASGNSTLAQSYLAHVSGNNYLSQIAASETANIAAVGSGNASLASIATYEGPASKSFTPTFAANLLAKGAAGTLFGVNGFSNYTGVQYLHIYDNTASTANLISVLTIDSKDNFSIDFGAKGITMNSGIYIANSLTPVVQTNGAADIFITAYFK